MDRIGVGFIGQGEEGRFHLERFRFRTDCRCEAVWFSTRDLTIGNPARLAAKTVLSAHEIPANTSISLVVIDVPLTDRLFSHEVAAECLRHGQHVLMGFQGFDRPENLVELAEIARLADRQLFVPALHRWESSFLGVQSVIASGCLGDLIQIRKISRQYVPEELSQPKQIVTDFSQSLDRLWFEMLDELLEFWPQPVKLISAADEYAPDLPATRQSRTGRSVELKFVGGCVVHLELNRRSLAPLETGWVLEGRSGGFADRKKYRATADFELVDVPVEFPPTDQNGFYNAVVATIRDGRPFPVTLNSVQRVLELMLEER
ncbi:MAG: Nucleoside-diphosphate-sugar epimerase [Planctomycetaceae bacterium]|nr:Nucleoside-diphosphate-sugar epimerase [Planctomycetaceae bacterium]